LDVKAEWEHGNNQLQARRKEEKGKRTKRKKRKIAQTTKKVRELRLLLSSACEGGKDGT
jgi:hypothetical protein